MKFKVRVDQFPGKSAGSILIWLPMANWLLELCVNFSQTSNCLTVYKPVSNSKTRGRARQKVFHLQLKGERERQCLSFLDTAQQPSRCGSLADTPVDKISPSAPGGGPREGDNPQDRRLQAVSSVRFDANSAVCQLWFTPGQGNIWQETSYHLAYR